MLSEMPSTVPATQNMAEFWQMKSSEDMICQWSIELK